MGTIVNMVTTINVGISYMDTINMWYIIVKIWLYRMDENIVPIMLHGAGILINIYPENHPVLLPKMPKWFPPKIWNQQHHMPLPSVQPGTERCRNYEAGRCCDDYYLFKSRMFNATIESYMYHYLSNDHPESFSSILYLFIITRIPSPTYPYICIHIWYKF